MTSPLHRQETPLKHPSHKEGSRQHVLSWSNLGRHCSEPRCEINAERIVRAAVPTEEEPR